MSDSDKVCKIINCEYYSDCVCEKCDCLEKAYNKGRADAIEAFIQTKAEVVSWLVKRLQEWYETTNGALLEHIYDIAESMKGDACRADAMTWIPCSERLPEDRRVVLVTAYWHGTYQIMEACYFGDGVWWCVPYNNCGKHMQRLNPKAWMPLPEPYNEQMKVEHDD